MKKEGDMKAEELQVEVDPEDKAQEEEPKGSADVVLVAQGVQLYRASQWLAGVMGGVGGSQRPVRLALPPSLRGRAENPRAG